MKLNLEKYREETVKNLLERTKKMMNQDSVPHASIAQSCAETDSSAKCATATEMTPDTSEPKCFIVQDEGKANAKPILNGPKEKGGKPDWSIFPFDEAEFVLEVFEYGAKKYNAPFTYRQLVDHADLFSAALRHLVAIQNMRECDLESGCYHWAHVAANALMALSHCRNVKF